MRGSGCPKNARDPPEGEEERKGAVGASLQRQEQEAQRCQTPPFAFSLGRKNKIIAIKKKRERKIKIASGFPPSSFHHPHFKYFRAASGVTGDTGPLGSRSQTPERPFGVCTEMGNYCIDRTKVFSGRAGRSAAPPRTAERSAEPGGGHRLLRYNYACYTACSFICCSYNREGHVQITYMFYFGSIFFFFRDKTYRKGQGEKKPHIITILYSAERIKIGVTELYKVRAEKKYRGGEGGK